ncbi:hypothetical protein [Herminiimonas arsenitoxidans]|uniref:hypothetical protein n=1 Tax=Herminiimonas arsenitoxidans TaxID=1809410 RepID=UPI001E644366|nr:hypothetical protein [Herminiimonas arsenitoxidans]
MKKILITSLIALFGCAATNAFAEIEPLTPAPVVSAPTSTLFLKPVSFRGVVGDVQVQVNLRPKADIEEGIEGEYFIFGNSNKILLAGEVEGDQLLLEESENGTNISGQWDGKIDGDAVAGLWTSADGSITKPFSLKAIALKQSAAPARAVKKVATSTNSK